MTSTVTTTQKLDLLWLDSQSNRTSVDNQNTINHLQRLTNTIQTFTDANDFIRFVENLVDRKGCIIVSGAFAQHIVNRVHDMPQVNCIFIFCLNTKYHGLWVKEWSKIKGVFTDIIPICDILEQTESSIKVTSFNTELGCLSNKVSDQPDPSPIYGELLPEILFTTTSEQKHSIELSLVVGGLHHHIPQREDIQEGLIPFNNFLSTSKRPDSSVQLTHNGLLNQNLMLINIYRFILLPRESDFPQWYYNNIGNIHNRVTNYSKALSYHSKTSEPQQQSLPSIILLWCVRLCVIFYF